MSWYCNKRILITGGCGFIGSHILDSLVSQNAIVTVLDNLSSGSLENISAYENHKNVTFIEGDIRDEEACKKATQKCDVVFHCAAFISVANSTINPKECFAVNVEGTHNLLSACVTNKVGHFVFSSSAAVYGSRQTPCKESDTLSPQSPYGASKMEGESLCKHYAQRYKISCAILRYFNVYGPRQRIGNSYAAVVAAFNDQLQTGKPLTIFGTGLQTRDFVPVEHVVAANLLVGSSDSLHGEIFNIATGKSITLFELIGMLAHTMRPPRLELLFAPSRDGDVAHSSADCSKYEQFASSNNDFILESKEISRSGETGRHARFRF